MIKHEDILRMLRDMGIPAEQAPAIMNGYRKHMAEKKVTLPNLNIEVRSPISHILEAAQRKMSEQLNSSLFSGFSARDALKEPYKFEVCAGAGGSSPHKVETLARLVTENGTENIRLNIVELE